MRRFRHDPVRGRRRGRFGMHNEVRSVVITRFGQMHLVANPGLVPLDAQVSVRVVGGGNQQGRRGDIIIATPAAMSLFLEKLLDPHAAQRFHRRQFPQPGGSRGLIHGRQ